MAKKPKFRNTSPYGWADIERLKKMSDAEIERTAPPELPFFPADFWKDAKVVMPPAKEAISLRVDADVLEWFRAAGPRYQTRMNAVLRSYVREMAPSKSRPKSRKSR
jgi:uncharacterized protein (DUF4415 family)